MLRPAHILQQRVPAAFPDSSVVLQTCGSLVSSAAIKVPGSAMSHVHTPPMTHLTADVLRVPAVCCCRRARQLRTVEQVALLQGEVEVLSELVQLEEIDVLDMREQAAALTPEQLDSSQAPAGRGKRQRRTPQQRQAAAQQAAELAQEAAAQGFVDWLYGPTQQQGIEAPTAAASGTKRTAAAAGLM